MHTVRGTRYAGMEEAAKFLGISSQTLKAWIKKGRLPEVDMWTVKGRRSRCFTAPYLARAAKAEKPNMNATDIASWVTIFNIDTQFGNEVAQHLRPSD